MNIIIASRLETVKPCYIKKDPINIAPLKIRLKNDSNTEQAPSLRILNIGESVILNAPHGYLNHIVGGTDNSVERLNINTILTNKAMNPKKQIKSPAKQKPRVPKVLLEYVKVQNGQTIDTVVMKEPFKDRYAVFGIDVTSGQRFELHFSSEEVFNVLEGDMLVTSVEDKAVWTALLEKVELLPVLKFTKFLPSLVGQEVQEKFQNASIFIVEDQEKHFDSFEESNDDFPSDDRKKVIIDNEIEETAPTVKDTRASRERQESYASDDAIKDQGQQQKQQQYRQQQTVHQQPQEEGKKRKPSIPSYMRSRKTAVEDDAKPPQLSNGINTPAMMGEKVRQGEAMSRLAVPPNRPPPLQVASRTVRTKKQSTHDVTSSDSGHLRCVIQNTIEDIGTIISDDIMIESDEGPRNHESDKHIDLRISNTFNDDKVSENRSPIAAPSSSQLVSLFDNYPIPSNKTYSEKKDTTNQPGESKTQKAISQPQPPVAVKTARILQGRKYRGKIIEKKNEATKPKEVVVTTDTIVEIPDFEYCKEVEADHVISIACSENRWDGNEPFEPSPDIIKFKNEVIAHKPVVPPPNDDFLALKVCHVDSDTQANIEILDIGTVFCISKFISAKEFIGL